MRTFSYLSLCTTSLPRSLRLVHLALTPYFLKPFFSLIPARHAAPSHQHHITSYGISSTPLLYPADANAKQRAPVICIAHDTIFVPTSRLFFTQTNVSRVLWSVNLSCHGAMVPQYSQSQYERHCQMRGGDAGDDDF